MFTEQPYYEAKVFLKSYNDAITCLRQDTLSALLIFIYCNFNILQMESEQQKCTERVEAAEQKAQVEFQEHVLQSLATARTRQELDVRDGQVVPGLNFGQSKQTKLFQFSNLVFAKYLKGFEEYSGNFKGFQQIVIEGLKKMKSDVK